MRLHHDRLREELGRKSRRLVQGLDCAVAARKERDWILKIADELLSAKELRRILVRYLIAA